MSETSKTPKSRSIRTKKTEAEAPKPPPALPRDHAFIVPTRFFADLAAAIAPVARGEVRIRFSDGHGIVEAVDPSHVSMAIVKFPAWTPVRGLPPFAEGTEFALDLEDPVLIAYLKGQAAGSSLHLSVTVPYCRNQKDPPKFTLSSPRSQMSTGFLDPDRIILPKIPTVAPPVSVHLSGATLTSAARRFTGFTDHIILSAFHGRFGVFGESDRGRLQEILPALGEGNENPDEKPITCTYPLDFFKDMTSAVGSDPSPKARDVTLRFGFEYPLRLSGTPKPGWTVEYLLACQIDEERGGKPILTTEDWPMEFPPIDEEVSAVPSVIPSLDEEW